MKFFEQIFESTHWKRRFLAVLVMVVCLTVGFAGFFSASPAQAEGFSVKDINGKTHALADYKGKWVLVNYWATWCPPCLEEIPDLIALHDKRKNKDFAVIGIAVDFKDKKEIADFANNMLMSYPIVLADDKVLQQFGPAEVLPTSYIYNPQGKLVKTHRGLITQPQVEKLISGK